VFFLGVWYLRKKSQDGETGVVARVNYLGLFPQFVLGFLGMALLRTLGIIPDLTIHLSQEAFIGSSDYNLSLSQLAQEGSRICVVMSMAGVGLETKFSAMKQTGIRPFLAGMFGAITIALLVLGAVVGLKM
jgi:uncharacterized membrane protein YadS